MVGPDCILVHRTSKGFRCAARDEAEAIQRIAFHEHKPGWLFIKGCRIADALNSGQVALAQIYGVHASSKDDLSDRQLGLLARVAPIVKANFNPDEPRDWHGR